LPTSLFCPHSQNHPTLYQTADYQIHRNQRNLLNRHRFFPEYDGWFCSSLLQRIGSCIFTNCYKYDL